MNVTHVPLKHSFIDLLMLPQNLRGTQKVSNQSACLSAERCNCEEVSEAWQSLMDFWRVNGWIKSSRRVFSLSSRRSSPELLWRLRLLHLEPNAWRRPVWSVSSVLMTVAYRDALKQPCQEPSERSLIQTLKRPGSQRTDWSISL